MNWTAISSSGIPFARLAFAGTFLLASIGMVTNRAPAPVAHAGSYELVLHPDRAPIPLEYFGSQWNTGPVVVTHDASDGQTLEFTKRWPLTDGCWWASTETLTPINGNQYRYVYTDHIVSCDEADDEDDNDTRVEWVPTSRTGIVNVVPLQ
jgi:hypothetical protein